MEREHSFAHWVKQRRKALDLTQDDVAQLVGCAVVTIQKIEEERRRPSKQVVELLAKHLGIAAHEREAFLRSARSGAIVPRTAPPPQLSDPGTPTNVPVPLTPLIGRATELGLISRYLERPNIRLMTLVGPAGVGKTCLSVQVAGEMCEQFPDGVWFIALAAIREPYLLVQTIAHVLGLTEAGTQPLMERLKTTLRAKRTLLVLDNFEQIVEAAPFITELLAACRQMKVLITSRRRLQVYGEHEYTVEPFPIPIHTSSGTLEELMGYEVVQLFIARVQAFNPNFVLTADNAQAIAKICTWLDGLPLAIELAAARVRQFTPETLAMRLSREGDNPFPLLSDGPRDLPVRQQTLYNAIAWSYELLDSRSQQLFRRMGVFVGGCTVAALTAVCGGTYPNDLAALVEQSLVRQTMYASAEPRVTMLEIICEYALVQLTESGERASIEQAHVAYFLKQAQHGQDVVAWLDRAEHVQDEIAWLDRMEVDHDNLRATLRWALAHDVAAGLRLCTALWWFWEVHGHWSEGRRWIEAMLATAEDASPHLRMQTLRCVGSLAWKQGDYVQGTAAMRESLALNRTLDDTRTTPYTLMILGQMELDQGNYTQAASLLWESLALKRTSGDPAPGVLMHLSQLALAQGDYTHAQRLGEECLEACQQARNTFYASPALRVLGAAALAQGEYKRARTFLRESVARSGTIRHRRTIAFALAAFAGAVASDPESLADDVRAAARIWGAVEELREEVGIFLPVAERTHYELAVAMVRAHLDEATFVAAWAEGRAMTLEQVIAYALETSAEPPSSAVAASDFGGQGRARANTRRAMVLSAREVDVLGLVAEGYTDQEVAARLGLRPRTVTSYLTSIYDKLEVRTRMAAVRVARTQQIL